MRNPLRYVSRNRLIATTLGVASAQPLLMIGNGFLSAVTVVLSAWAVVLLYRTARRNYLIERRFEQFALRWPVGQA